MLIYCYCSGKFRRFETKVKNYFQDQGDTFIDNSDNADVIITDDLSIIIGISSKLVFYPYSLGYFENYIGISEDEYSISTDCLYLLNLGYRYLDDNSRIMINWNHSGIPDLSGGILTSNNNNRFIIIIPSYNCAKYLPGCLDSVIRQTYTNYQVCLIDDASTDFNHQRIALDYCQKYNWRLIINQNNKKALHNIVTAIQIINPREDDVIFLLDGDDQLTDRCLEILNHEYSPTTELTYGNYLQKSRLVIPEHTLNISRLRDQSWYFSHPRTWRYRLFTRLDLNLLKENGDYYQLAWDLALMYPLIELAYPYVKFIRYPLYIYNDENQLSDNVLFRDEQYATSLRIRKI